MKKLFFVLAIGAFTACNNSTSTDNTTDSMSTSVDSAAKETKNNIDSTVDSQKDSLDALKKNEKTGIDSSVKMTKDSLKDKM